MVRYYLESKKKKKREKKKKKFQLFYISFWFKKKKRKTKVLITEILTHNCDNCCVIIMYPFDMGKLVFQQTGL